MELLDIVYTVLIGGFSLLMTVVIVSWVFSKSKRVENPLLREQVNPAPKIKVRATHSRNNGHFSDMGHSTNSKNSPMIFPIGEHTSGSEKIIRRESHITSEEIPNRFVNRGSLPNQKRYQVVNEEIKKTGISKIANFYF
ncbi:MAG: hypothetical protein M0P71_09505 [Melioribacteraceae bacterium]|nr:hypothetical protein [Melioribacteraceae bacterium]